MRLRASAGAAVDGGRTVIQSARDHEISWPVTLAPGRAPEPDVLHRLTTSALRKGPPGLRAGRRRQGYSSTAFASLTSTESTSSMSESVAARSLTGCRP